MRSNAILTRVVSLIILALFTLLFFRYVDFYQETGEVLADGVLSTSNKLVTETLNQSPVNFPASLQGVLLENNTPKQTMHVS